MDADKFAQFKQLISDMDEPESLITLRAMVETLQQAMAGIQFDLMLSWMQQGWAKNPPGLVCHVCGAPTYGKQDGSTELVKCTDLMCGITRKVMVQ